MVGIHVPLHTHGGPGQDGDAGSLGGPSSRSDYRPQPQSGIGTKISRTEVLLPQNGYGEVPKGPGPYIHLDATVAPPILDDETGEADPSEADSEADLPGVRAPDRGCPGPT